jgi:NADH-quinone oxidoreductase subunit L
MILNTFVPCIVFLPLFSFIVISLTGTSLKKSTVSLISIINMFLSLTLSIILLIHMLLTLDKFKLFTFTLCKWIDVGNCHVSWLFIADALTLSMCFLVTMVSLFVHIYSTEYMKEDINFKKFISYLSLFTFFMLILITDCW